MMNRREWMVSTAWWISATWAANRASAFAQRPRFASDPFALGVASGDPLPDGVVLWTRLIGGDLRENVEVIWEISTDDQMRRIVRNGRAAARPEFAHSVHVEVNGLAPARWYYYRFRVGDAASPIGRTRTAPAPSTRLDRFNFAFASCQNFSGGYYTAYEHLAKEEIELVVFLGDYIYEFGPRPGDIRPPNIGETHTLEEYRGRYAQYKSDPLLREVHRLFPWIVVWDDHELANNWASQSPEWSQPDPNFLTRRANAAKAYYEHMPLRRAALPQGPDIRVFRRFDYGDLIRFHMLDTRQFRSRQACGDGIKNCAEINDAGRTMLGREQENWLQEGLDKSRARWNVIGNQIMMTKVDRTPGPVEEFSMDDWAGYEAARSGLTEYLGTRRPSGPVVITGNNHHHFVGDMKTDYRNPAARTVATELLGTSISSGGDGDPTSAGVVRWNESLKENPQARYYLNKRGYVVCNLDRDGFHADFRKVEQIHAPGAPIETSARFLIENRQPGANRL